MRVIGANLLQNCGVKATRRLGSLETLPAEPPSGVDAGVFSSVSDAPPSPRDVLSFPREELQRRAGLKTFCQTHTAVFSCDLEESPRCGAGGRTMGSENSWS